MSKEKKKVGAPKKYSTNPTPISVRVIGEKSKMKIRTLEKQLLKEHEIK